MSLRLVKPDPNKKSLIDKIKDALTVDTPDIKGLKAIKDRKK